MPDPVTVGVGVAGTLGAGYLGAKGAESAATTASDAQSRAAQLEYEQYLQGRQDLTPYRDVAVGQETYGDGFRTAEDAYLAANPDVLSSGMDARQHYEAYGKKEGREWFEPQYSGGALNQLSDYGPSRVLEGDYIPESDIPIYQRSDINQPISDFGYSGEIPQFSVQGDIPAFDSTQFDIYKDPSYDWRVAEQERGINRNMAGMGKVTSGNRLEEIMKRSGEMASQEYKDAYGRMLTDYGIRRENEATQYGRDVYGYGEGRKRETDIYGRAIGEYGLTRGAEDARYGRAVDQYGRDLTAYNADVARENRLYGRGVDAYGRAYGSEGDYLNRLAALSNVGQTAVNTGVSAGSTSAANQGTAIMAAGQWQAAGELGKYNAYGGAVGDLASIYAMSKYGQPPPIQNYYNNFSQYGPVQPPGYY